MKSATHFLLALIAVVSFTFTGCKKDKNEPDNIVGRWQFVKSEYKETMNGQTTNETNNAPAGSFLEFKADGSFIGKVEDMVSGRWVLNDDRLHLDGGGMLESNTSGYEIKKLTKSELVLYGKDVDGSYSTEETVYLKR